MEIRDLKVCVLSSYQSAPTALDQKLNVYGAKNYQTFSTYGQLEEFLKKNEGPCLLIDLLGNENLKFNFDLSYFLSQASAYRVAQGLRWVTNNGTRPLVEIDSDFKIISEEIHPDTDVIDGLTRLPLYYFDSKTFLESIDKNGIDYKNEEWIGLPMAYPNLELDYSQKVPALFLDRDGVINVDKGYVYQYEEVIYNEEIFPIIKMFNEKKWPVFILTNQSGVGQGKYLEADVIKLHNRMREDFAEKAVEIKAWQYSPYHFDKGIGEYKRLSFTRKPGSGMALKILEQVAIDLESSFMIGDKATDRILIPGLTTLLIKGNYKVDGTNAVIFEKISEIEEYIREQI